MMTQPWDMRLDLTIAERATDLWHNHDDEYHGQSAEAFNVTITAPERVGDTGNQGIVYLGWWKVNASSGTETGHPLRPGEQKCYKHICLKNLYAAAAVVNDALLISYEAPANR